MDFFINFWNAMPFKIVFIPFVCFVLFAFLWLRFSGDNSEYSLRCYYGRRGRGKTYGMTWDILSALNRGRIVYTNYEIKWDGFDEHEIPLYNFLEKIGWRKCECYPETNLRRFSNINRITELSGCILALDEGYLYFDSYLMTRVKMSIRKAILMSRHNDVEIWYTAQRTISIHRTLRSMTEIFYKFHRINIPFLGLYFYRTAHDIGNDENVDEEISFGMKFYKLNKRIYRCYDTKGSVFYDESMDA